MLTIERWRSLQGESLQPWEVVEEAVEAEAAEAVAEEEGAEVEEAEEGLT